MRQSQKRHRRHRRNGHRRRSCSRPAKETEQLPLEQVEVRGSQHKAKIGGNILFLVDEVSDCGDGTMEEEGRVGIETKRTGSNSSG